MISLIHKIYLRIFAEGIFDVASTLELSQQEKEAIAKVNKWRNGELSVSDEHILDSDKRFLLLASKDRLFLVERNGRWKSELDQQALDLYAEKGRKAFRRIRNRIS